MMPCTTDSPRPEPSPTGFVHVENAWTQAYLLVPDEIDPERRYPLITVLHGAGRQDDALAKAYRDEPERRQALFLIPRSTAMTWDLIASEQRLIRPSNWARVGLPAASTSKTKGNSPV